MIKHKLIKSFGDHRDISMPNMDRDDPLMRAVIKQTHEFGWGYSDSHRLAEWIVDSPPVDDDEEHWANIRPY